VKKAAVTLQHPDGAVMQADRSIREVRGVDINRLDIVPDIEIAVTGDRVKQLLCLEFKTGGQVAFWISLPKGDAIEMMGRIGEAIGALR